ncbi:MAG: group III truncated hemoglobin [Chitinophagaceae bacterium]|nr:group III truncated hemoglobin [Chitinophagaceae bacterium]
MKKDIENRDDIINLVNTFYDKVKPDETIGYFFSKTVHVDWEKHLPVMYNFWENIIFHVGSYSGNPMKHHISLHQKSPMKKEHFNRWIQLFNETVDELFEGEHAEQAKQRALSIATVMQINIAQLPADESIY